LRNGNRVDEARRRSTQEAVIFDMDGVVVDSEPHHQRVFEEICRYAGVDGKLGPSFADYVGRSDVEFWTAFVKHHKIPLTIEQIQTMKRERIIECFRRERPFYPGLTHLLKRTALTYRLALASGSDRPLVNAVLEIGNLSKFFEVCVTSSEVPAGKPRPDIFLKTAALLKVEPADCWVIEDSKPGVAAGLAAGMRVIAITNTHAASQLSDATHVVGSCAEIERILCG